MSPIKFSFKFMYISLFEAKEYNKMDEIFDDMDFFLETIPQFFSGGPSLN